MDEAGTFGSIYFEIIWKTMIELRNYWLIIPIFPPNAGEIIGASNAESSMRGWCRAWSHDQNHMTNSKALDSVVTSIKGEL